MSASPLTMPEAPERAVGEGLTMDNFTRIGVRGVTDARNSYCQGMAWFKDRLYVGMTRDSLCLLKRPARKLRPPKMEFWPVKCPDSDTPELWRGQIVCYDPLKKEWEKIYESPLLTEKGQTVMRDVGYRGMVVHRDPGSSEPSLYVGSMSGGGALVLRSEDGINFETTKAVLGSATSIRSLTSFKGKLFTAIVGKSGHHPNESAHTEVFVSMDPKSGRWQAASAPGFGDACNTAVFELGEANGFLYAATMNPVGGFQLWKTDAEGEPPYRWTKVITAGAYRGFLNEYGISMIGHGDCLYVGTGISGGGYDQVYKVGPAPSELLRVHPDDTWDLIVGAPRITPEGLKVPLSGLGPGFNNFMTGYTWRMCTHEGWLYVGTMNAAVFLPYSPYGFEQAAGSKFKDFAELLPGSVEDFIKEYGGCHLWRTHDGERLYPVTRNGFGTVYNMGIRQMTSTPYGLFVGTANPFGPLVGIKRDGVWRYEENPRGGAEVWLGSSGIRADMQDQGKQVPVCPSGAAQSLSREKQFNHALLKVGRQVEKWLTAIYTKNFFEDAGFNHIGIWREDTVTGRQACENLLDKMVSFIPEKKGPVLDVGSGLGGTTRYLLKYFKADEITGIEESQWAVDFSRAKVPNVRFLCMDPSRLEFADGTFSNIICAEGAQYFDTRFRFLKEAARVLKPGGRLLLADILFSKNAFVLNRGKQRANYVKDVESYKHLFVRAGFTPMPALLDLSGDSLVTYFNKISEFMREEYRSGIITEGRFNAAMSFTSRIILFARNYFLVEAVKNDISR